MSTPSSRASPADRRRGRRGRRLRRRAASAAGRAPRLMSTTLVARSLRRGVGGGLRTDGRILDAGLVRSGRPILDLHVGLASSLASTFSTPSPAFLSAVRPSLSVLCLLPSALRPSSPASLLSRPPALARRLRRRRRRLRRRNCRIAWPTFTLSPAFTLISFDRAGDRGRHFDRRLVGFELEDRLILGDRVAGLDQHAQDVAGFDLFAELGECEISQREPLTNTSG